MLQLQLQFMGPLQVQFKATVMARASRLEGLGTAFCTKPSSLTVFPRPRLNSTFTPHPDCDSGHAPLIGLSL